MIVDLLNTARFQNFKYQEQGIFRTSRRNFRLHNSRNNHVWYQAWISRVRYQLSKYVDRNRV